MAALGSAALRASLHDDLAGIDLVVEDVCTVNSFAIDLPGSFAVSRRIAAHSADPAVSGVVVTHGTDTMEESAWIADLTVDTDKPSSSPGRSVPPTRRTRMARATSPKPFASPPTGPRAASAP